VGRPWEKLFGKPEYALGSRSDIVHRAEDETDEDGWIRSEGGNMRGIRRKTANAIGPKRAAGRMTEGATEVMEGMAVGGKCCCPITVYGGGRLSRKSWRSCKSKQYNNNYCSSCPRIYLFIFNIIIHHPSLSRLASTPLLSASSGTPYSISTISQKNPAHTSHLLMGSRGRGPRVEGRRRHPS